MNNASISLEEPQDITPRLNEEEAKVVKIVEAIREVQSTKGWSTLKAELFDHLVDSLEKDIKNEARKEDADVRKLNRLSGSLEWAEKYSDLFKLENRYMVQLTNIRKQLHGKSE